MTYTEYVTFNGKKYVSLSVIDKIKAEMEEMTHDENGNVPLKYVIEIIDQTIKELDT